MYDFCISTKSQNLTTKTGPIKPAAKPSGNNRQNNVTDGANIVGGEVYNKVKNHLKVYLEKICEVRLHRQDLSGYMHDSLRIFPKKNRRIFQSLRKN